MSTSYNTNFTVGQKGSQGDSMTDTTTEQHIELEAIVTDVLALIDQEREREIIARRFGLFDRKETLEQIGELLGITRERVRQLEKSVMTRLRSNSADLPHVSIVQESLSTALKAAGETARVTTLGAELTAENSRTDQS